ncbi:GTPase Era [Halothermothrix orenii]|uniref:GTPase Era n=1 Tax=Halothermothrix orenii (strain H 168 / OCM 544 / DSM 9562) TaxID=373903 RepID=ERA_HALOH|nr:GTPase Era [Halothermothrix orenii]B8CXI2.1 RecName: Full=GTPase Era [Halothermothrix orenii H 168]ACL70001.1 GTP-binding protein Era [Halothermothrix orenii H 168]
MSYKSGFVSVIGRPNVGKSTLINNLIGQKVVITSPRPQTTRNSVRGIYTRPEGQIVFVDTPGIHKARNKLDNYMLEKAYESLEDIDVIIFMVDGNYSFGKGDEFIYNQIKGVRVPVIVAMNKIDRINKEIVMERQKNYEERTGFPVIPISASRGTNLDTLVEEIFTFLPEGPQYYPEDMVTDQIEQFVVAELIREKVFILTREEVPYGVAVKIEEMKERDNSTMYIRANIYAEKKSHKKIIIGHKGKMIKKIGRLAREEIEKLLQTKVYLDLWVKIEKDWREKEGLVKRMGYKG